METSFNEQDVVSANEKFNKQVSRVTGIGSLILVIYVVSRS